MANWALIIGITSYQQGRGFNRLDCAVNDARAMHSYCHDEAKFDKVFLFCDDSDPIRTPNGTLLETKPTSTNLKAFLYDYFELPRLTAGDNFWFSSVVMDYAIRKRIILFPTMDTLDCSKIQLFP